MEEDIVGEIVNICYELEDKYFPQRKKEIIRDIDVRYDDRYVYLKIRFRTGSTSRMSLPEDFVRRVVSFRSAVFFRAEVLREIELYNYLIDNPYEFKVNRWGDYKAQVRREVGRILRVLKRYLWVYNRTKTICKSVRDILPRVLDDVVPIGGGGEDTVVERGDIVFKYHWEEVGHFDVIVLTAEVNVDIPPPHGGHDLRYVSSVPRARFLIMELDELYSKAYSLKQLARVSLAMYSRIAYVSKIRLRGYYPKKMRAFKKAINEEIVRARLKELKKIVAKVIELNKELWEVLRDAWKEHTSEVLKGVDMFYAGKFKSSRELIPNDMFDDLVRVEFGIKEDFDVADLSDEWGVVVLQLKNKFGFYNGGIVWCYVGEFGVGSVEFSSSTGRGNFRYTVGRGLVDLFGLDYKDSGKVIKNFGEVMILSSDRVFEDAKDVSSFVVRGLEVSGKKLRIRRFDVRGVKRIWVDAPEGLEISSLDVTLPSGRYEVVGLKV